MKNVWAWQQFAFINKISKKKKNLKNNSVLKNRETVLDQDSSDLPSMSIQMHTWTAGKLTVFCNGKALSDIHHEYLAALKTWFK